MRPVFLLLVGIPALVFAQGTPKSLLWRVSGAELLRSSYLYGTMHSQDERVFRFGDSVLVALESCDIVAGEIMMDELEGEGVDMLGGIMMPGDTRLKDLYRKKEYAVVEAFMQEKIGPMAIIFQRAKPFFVMAFIMEQDMEQDQALMLDDHLQELGRQHGARVIGIETVAEQMAAVDRIPLKEQAQMLLETARQDPSDGHADMEGMLEVYLDQDLDGLIEVGNADAPMGENMEAALLVDRNKVMVHRLDSILHTGETLFFAVGAAHLPTDDGLIELLRARGYTVEPVFSTWVRREEIEQPVEDKE